MKRSLLTFFLADFIILLLASWGNAAHQVIAKIAAYHLTSNTQAAIKDLLGNQSLEYFAAVAARERKKPVQRPLLWKDANMKSNILSYDDFIKSIQSDPENICNSILEQENILKNKNSHKAQKINALKKMIYLVGEAHDPFFFNPTNDNNDKSTKILFDHKMTTFEDVWENKLIEKQGFNYDELAQQIDKSTPERLKRFQNDAPLSWVWESYRLNLKLHTQMIDSMRNIDYDKQAYVNIVNERIEVAGLRLARLLNILYKGPGILKYDEGADDFQAKAPAISIPPTAAKNYINQMVKLSSKVFSVTVVNHLTQLNLGAEYPNQLVTVILSGKTMSLIQGIEGKMITVSGVLININGKPEIIIQDLGQIVIK